MAMVRLCCRPALVRGEPWRTAWRKEAVCPPRRRHHASPRGPSDGAAAEARPWGGAPEAGKAGGGSGERFAAVYRFPGIRHCRVLSRLKLLQTAATLLVLPPACYLHLQQQLSQPALLYAAGVALFAGAMLYGMSYFFRRIIGAIYLSESGRTVRVAHLTFWGRRNDIYCPLETVMTLDEVGDAKGERLLRFKRYDSADILYFTIKYGQIVDRQKFEQIFGELQ